MTTVALIFDFDDTLVPDSTTKLIREHKIDPDEFWGIKAKALIAEGYNPTQGFLKLLLDHVGPDQPLGLLTNQDLRDFGATLDDHFFSGIPELFEDLKTEVGKFDDIYIEYYIISGGLQAVIEGSSIVQKYFKAVYGCELAEDGDPPMLRYIKKAISFTEKTRYLFEINKGLLPVRTIDKPYLVNKNVPKKSRRVQFKNMIYVGDGLTDIPCFSLLKSFHGTCFGVFDPTDVSKAKRSLLELLKPQRVIGLHSPRYGPEDDLGALLRAAVSSICGKIVVEQQTAEYDLD